jgi:hypothetical protein
VTFKYLFHSSELYPPDFDHDGGRNSGEYTACDKGMAIVVKSEIF